MDEITVSFHAGDVVLLGDLTIPKQARGVVLIAHGSGSSRKSSRNRFVAGMFREYRLATLLLDLLSEQEKVEGEIAFDLERLGERVTDVVRWLGENRETSNLPIGLFGASTGAAVAVIAAVRSGNDAIQAIVSRGGRADMASNQLSLLQVPILFIVGSEDRYVLELNKESMNMVTAEKRLEVIEGASHLFEEPGALDRVGDLSVSWFEEHLKKRG